MVRTPGRGFSARVADAQQTAGWAVQRVRHSKPVQRLGASARRTLSAMRSQSPSAHLPERTQRVTATSLDWPLSVLTVGERSLPQCYHYRVRQKADLFSRLDIPYDEVGLDDPAEARSRLQLARVLIIYRLPYGPSTLALIKEARRLRIPVVFEVDDIVYRQDLVAANPNLETLPWSLRAATVRGARDYERMMALADVNLASTEALARDMREHNGRPAFVVENGIDDQMLAVLEGLRADPPPPREVSILYGSGSRAHDHDFALAAGGIARWLRENPAGCLTLVGSVAVPEALHGVASQIRRLPELPFAEYLRELQRSTVSIAPLTGDAFNRYKSNIRYLESGLVGTPLIASPMVYGDYIEDGRTGIIAEDHDWYGAIKRVVADPALRTRIASDARDDVSSWELSGRPLTQLQTWLDAVVGGSVAVG